ncbi:MAG: restriction endonuclease subunit S [Cyclobacteriaceae bacterium]
MEVVHDNKTTDAGVIPVDWILCRQEEIVRYINGRAYKLSEWENYGTPVIRLQNLTGSGETYYYSNLKLPEQQYVNRGDLIFMWSATFGPFIWSGPKAIYHYHIWKVECRAKVDKLFYYHKLVELTESLKKETNGSTMLHITKGEMEKYVLAIPPTKAEQTAIATALSDTDALITSLEKLIAKKRNIKQGAMQELLKPRVNWTLKGIGEIAYVVGGGTPSTIISEYWNGDIEWFTPTEIGISKYVFNSERKITKKGLANSSAQILPIGTVLLTSRAGIGDVSILKKTACTNQGFQSLVAKPSTDNEYLYYLVLTLKSTLLQNASGSTFLEISPSKVRQIQVHVPPFEEQCEISSVLRDMDSEITAIESKLQKCLTLKQGMMQTLLTGKIRLL